MRHPTSHFFCAIAMGAMAFACVRTQAQPVVTYRGICDASAAVALDARHFVVADDERNTLRVYARDRPDAVGALDLAPFLGTAPDKESDIEGAARVDSTIYWISSHGRNSSGKVQERRHRFFATELVASVNDDAPGLQAVGKPYSRLLDDLVSAPRLRTFEFAKAATLAPEAPGGLNIEGLAATPEGKLLIGFRNPVVNGKALVVPLENPRELLTGGRAVLGAVVALDLGGRGIRSIEAWGKGYLIVAGPPADEGTFALYGWSGKTGDVPRAVPNVDFGSLRPEALFVVPETGRVQILSDDGGVEVAGTACKKLAPAQRSFRSITIETQR